MLIPLKNNNNAANGSTQIRFKSHSTEMAVQK